MSTTRIEETTVSDVRYTDYDFVALREAYQIVDVGNPYRGEYVKGLSHEIRQAMAFVLEAPLELKSALKNVSCDSDMTQIAQNLSGAFPGYEVMADNKKLYLTVTGVLGVDQKGQIKQTRIVFSGNSQPIKDSE